MERKSYHELNAELNLFDENGQIQFHKDKEAAHNFFVNEDDGINSRTVFFHDLEEKVKYLVDNGHWDEEVVLRYGFEFLKSLFQYAHSFKHRFQTFLGAEKFYASYAMRTNNGEKFLERFEDRVVLTAIAHSTDSAHAARLVKHIIQGRFQPATPTFLNAGRVAAGGPTSCYLLRVDDNMESVARAQTDALQLSKRGGGVALSLSNVRESGAPIKNIEGLSSGVVPIMKILEDSFSYADQLGQRQGAGAVYLNIHHPDIVKFLDTKRENADEKIRIKTLSLGVVVPDITFELLKAGEDMYLFSPYDIKKHYGLDFTDFSMTDYYHTFANDERITKTKISSRKIFQTIAEIQFESGYPYLVFEDTVNYYNPAPNVGRISMSNLCVAPETRVLTDKGYLPIGELAGQTVNAWNGEKFSPSPVAKTGEDQELITVTLSNGGSLDVTPYHKFYINTEYGVQEVRAQHLNPGDRLEDYRLPDGSLHEVSVVSVTDNGRIADTYCLNEPEHHKVVFEGIQTGQCSEILQPQTPSVFNAAGEFEEPGRDIACNLGSLNVAKMQEANPTTFAETVYDAIEFLSNVAAYGDFSSSPTVERGNTEARAIGLGQMNLHGHFIEQGIRYDSEEAVQEWRRYIRAVTYYAISKSVELSRERSPFNGFEGSGWQSGAVIDGIIGDIYANEYVQDADLEADDWEGLQKEIERFGMYNQHLQAVPPTGSISYLNNSTSSIHPIAAKVEIRKEGKLGRVYYPAYGLSNENFTEVKTAYEMSPNAVIDMYAASTPYVDQGQSLTLFFKDTATTRELNRAQNYAHKSGVKTLYYIRIAQQAMSGTEISECVSCML